MFSDDNLLVDICVHLKPALSWMIKALWMLFCNPEFHLLQSPVSMGKYFKTAWSCLCAQLGEWITTRHLIISIPGTKRADLVTIISTTWNRPRKRFALRELDSLLGLVPNLALTTQRTKLKWIALQHAVFIAVKFNSNVVFSGGNTQTPNRPPLV